MSEEIKEIHIKTYDEWLKYYENATKEQVIEDLTRDVKYFADAVKDIKDLQQKVEQLENIRKEAKEECKSVIEDSEHTTVSEFNINGLMKIMLNILNKGSNKDE